MSMKNYIEKMLNDQCDRVFVTGLFLIHTLNKQGKEFINDSIYDNVFERCLKIRLSKLQYKTCLNRVMIIFAVTEKNISMIESACGKLVLFQIAIANQHKMSVYMNMFIPLLKKYIITVEDKKYLFNNLNHTICELLFIRIIYIIFRKFKFCH